MGWEVVKGVVIEESEGRVGLGEGEMVEGGQPQGKECDGLAGDSRVGR